MMDYIQRMEKELEELEERISKLESYEDKDYLMAWQLFKMIDYSLILKQRIRKAKGEEK